MPENVSAPERTTIFPEEFKVSKKPKGKKKGLKDAPYWDALAKKYLAGHRLPGWGVQLESSAMLIWMARTRITESMFYNVLMCTPGEFIKFNRKWPLRAFIGVLLEIREMRSSKIPEVG